jgi:hypothetical protein
MDPDANLKEQREIVRRMLDGTPRRSDGLRLAELVEALDCWIVTGGFLPKAWARK